MFEYTRLLTQLASMQAEQPDDSRGGSACQACLDQLDAYVMSEAREEDVNQQFPQVTAHLITCSMCMDFYTRFCRVAKSETNNQLASLKIPAFDFSFLHPKRSLLEQIGDAIQTIGGNICLQLSTELRLAMRPTLALAVRGEQIDPESKLFEFEPDEALLTHWPARMVAIRSPNLPEQCILKLQVKPAGRPFPKRKGIQVTVQMADSTRTVLTDAYGNAQVEAIPIAQLDQLQIEIKL